VRSGRSWCSLLSDNAWRSMCAHLLVVKVMSTGVLCTRLVQLPPAWCRKTRRFWPVVLPREI